MSMLLATSQPHRSSKVFKIGPPAPFTVSNATLNPQSRISKGSIYLNAIILEFIFFFARTAVTEQLRCDFELLCG